MSFVYIESSFQHWVSFSFHPYIYIHILLLNHWATSSTYFLSFLNFSSHYYLQKKQKQKQKLFLLPISTHLRAITLYPAFPFSFCLFTSPHYLLLYRYTSFIIFTFFIIWLFFFPFYLYTSTVTLPPTILFPLYLPHCSLLHHYNSFIIFPFFITWLFFFPFYLYKPTVTLPQTFSFPLCLFTSLTTLYLIVTFSLSFSLLYNLTLFLPILFVHTYGYSFSNLFLPSLPLYLPHYSLFHRYTSFVIFSFL